MLIGGLCLLVGVVMFLFSRDVIMLVLSGAICVGALWKAVTLFRMISKKNYEIVEGTCVSISQNPIRRYRKVKIMDEAGTESTLLLSKQDKIKIGFRYRFYFSKTQHITLGSEYFDAALSSDCFVGYEELGEYQQQAPEEKR
ncbi:MAG: hypothetical protein PHY23_00255 [Oscillospiraceae bacterium]|nr:hypothetical protein [Oscillospiraceae bacterium]